MKRKLWAIADLHLGFSTGKWMDKFGEHWVGHHKKIEMHWRDSIDENDIVLLPGDFSWAMKPAQVEEEFKWLRELPGIMVMIKGNHDYWWPGSHKKMNELLPERTYALKKTATIIEGLPIVGVRGGDLVPFGKKTQEDIDKELEREIKEFKASIAHLEELEKETKAVHPRIAMFHYPPLQSSCNDDHVAPPERSIFNRIPDHTYKPAGPNSFDHEPQRWKCYSRVFYS